MNLLLFFLSLASATRFVWNQVWISRTSLDINRGDEFASIGSSLISPTKDEYLNVRLFDLELHCHIPPKNAMVRLFRENEAVVLAEVNEVQLEDRVVIAYLDEDYQPMSTTALALVDELRQRGGITLLATIARKPWRAIIAPLAEEGEQTLSPTAKLWLGATIGIIVLLIIIYLATHWHHP